jgi:steroid Delta-isomerase
VTSDLSVVVGRYYEQIDAGDTEAALSCFAPAAVYRRPGYQPLAGLSSIEEYYRDVRVIGSGRHVVESLLVTDDEVAVKGRFDGVSRDGSPLAVRFADFWRFVDLLVIERDTYFDAAVL